MKVSVVHLFDHGFWNENFYVGVKLAEVSLFNPSFLLNLLLHYRVNCLFNSIFERGNGRRILHKLNRNVAIFDLQAAFALDDSLVDVYSGKIHKCKRETFLDFTVHLLEWVHIEDIVLDDNKGVGIKAPQPFFSYKPPVECGLVCAGYLPFCLSHC